MRFQVYMYLGAYGIPRSLFNVEKLFAEHNKSGERRPNEFYKPHGRLAALAYFLFIANNSLGQTCMNSPGKICRPAQPPTISAHVKPAAALCRNNSRCYYNRWVGYMYVTSMLPILINVSASVNWSTNCTVRHSFPLVES